MVKQKEVIRLDKLRVTFQPPFDDTGNVVQSVESIEVRRSDGTLLLQLIASSIAIFEWQAEIAGSIIGPFFVGVSMNATIEINPKDEIGIPGSYEQEY